MDDNEWEALCVEYEDYERWLHEQIRYAGGKRNKLALFLVTRERPLTDNERLFLVDYIQRPQKKYDPVLVSEAKGKQAMRNWAIRKKYNELRKTMNDRQARLELEEQFHLEESYIHKIVKVLQE